MMPKTSLRIGIVDYHGDFRRMVTDIIPDHHQVLRIPPGSPSQDADLLVDHHDASLNGRYSVPFLALPYGTVEEEHVRQWNANPRCVGILDISTDLARRFPQIARPILSFLPFYPDTPVYESTGEKVISLISKYEERFPDAYKAACSVTPHVYGDPHVPDIPALKEAKWLLHLKPQGGFVCNAVMKALACGVPVIMDDLTWTNGFFTNLVFHDHNGIVLPLEQIREFLRTCPWDRFQRIKRTCVRESWQFKRGGKWVDGWWNR